MKFTKMHGCGNDYIYINGFTEKVEQVDKPELVRRLSDRHFGIGAWPNMSMIRGLPIRLT